MLIDYDIKQEVSKSNSGVGIDKFYAMDTKGQKFDAVASSYQPDDATKEMRQLIVNHFRLGDLTMRKPRREFNDLSVLARMMVDQMAFNAYQPNNGDPNEGDILQAWRSKAMRPIARNKVISVAGHATSRILYPRVFAQDESSEEQRDAATVMSDLMEWAGNQSDFSTTALYATISALVNPASIIYTEYGEVYRQVKTIKQGGRWIKKLMLDEDFSGFRDEVVPVDELFIENIYEHDIQKQAWLVRRRVMSYENAAIKYQAYPNFQFVKKGVQLVYNDANTTFYEVYDINMRPEFVEEVTYWNKSLDVKIVMVNGVMLCEPENPNPRKDKLYPFVKFGYELVDEGKFFYYKSLIFKMAQDEKIINTLYPMIIDGTYLNLFPPMVVTGAESLSGEVYVPGAVTTIQSPDAQMRPIAQGVDINSGINALFNVEKSISETANDSMFSQLGGKKQTAYGISIFQQNANTILGLFVQMISKFVKDFGRLRVGDILQFLTIAEVNQMENTKLVYKTFLVNNKEVNGELKTRKIKFDSSLPETISSDEEKLRMSFDCMMEGGGLKSDTELYKVNPVLFRNLKFTTQINPDVLNPMSEELERQFNLDTFDKSIAAASAGVPVDMEQVFKDFVLSVNPKSKKDPSRYIKEQQTPMNALTSMIPQGKNMQNVPTEQGLNQKVASQGATPMM